MPPAPAPRRGFTLVELLVVIAIIGLLAGLISAVAWRVLLRAKTTVILLEINELDRALSEYKNKANDYPPNMGMVANDATLSGTTAGRTRADRFSRHVRTAFPRSTATYANIRSWMVSKRNRDAENYEYTYKSRDGSVQHLDLDTMDPAEALVFWLAGFPTPWDRETEGYIVGRKTYGFHNDETFPFKRDRRTIEQQRGLQLRTAPLFEFDETRLVDTDDDGWWEYIPRIDASRSGSNVAPYVYFDNRYYAGASAAGGIRHTGFPAAGDQRLSEWGMAVPYAAVFEGNTQVPIQWINGDKFQIICAGSDGMYGSNGTTQLRIPVYPSGRTFRQDDSFATPDFYDPEERDNLTNFAESELETAAMSQ